jgi:uncharacterized protein involved in exopolysaccharide biosynthesis
MRDDLLLPTTQSRSDARPSDVSGILEALFRQRWKFIVVAAAVFSVTLFWTFGTSKRFNSEMVLLVQNARGNEIVTPGQSGNTATVGDVSEEQLNSEVAVLNSNDIYDEVVSPGWSKRPHGSTRDAELMAHEKSVRALRANLDVAPVRSSHVITIKMVANTPQAAMSTLNSLLAAFLQKQREIGRLPGASQVFAQQAEQYAKDLDAARHDLAAYQNRHGFASLGDEENALQTKVLDLQASARDADLEISELQQRIKADNAQLAAIPERLSTVFQSSTSSGAVDQLKVLLVSLENRRAELEMKYKPSDPFLLQVNRQIANTVAGINQANAVGPHEITTDVNPLWEAAKRDLSTSEVTVKGLQARRASQTKQITALGSDLNDREQQSGAFDALQQRVAELENGYKAFIQKRDNSRVSDLMDQQQWLNVAVVQYPSLSLLPSHPQPRRDLTFGFFTALILGGCTVFFFETINQRVSTPADLDLTSQYPVLATFPFQMLAKNESIRLARVEEPADLTAEGQGRSGVDSRIRSAAMEHQA